MPIEFDVFAYGTFAGGLSIGATIALALFLLVSFFLNNTRTGRRIYAVGDDAHAADLMGLPRRRILVGVYAASGFFAALTAIYLVSRFSAGQPYTGANYTLASITPVVVGGTMLTGGRGGVIGTLLGVYLVSLLNNMLNFLDISSHYQLVVQGLVIILAVSVYVEKQRGWHERGAHHHGQAARREPVSRSLSAAPVALRHPPVPPRRPRGRRRGGPRLPVGRQRLEHAPAVRAARHRGDRSDLRDPGARARPLGRLRHGDGGGHGDRLLGVNADVPFVFATAILIGMAVGLVNGLLVTRRRVSPFLATLATMIVLQGARTAWTQGAPSGNVPPVFRTIGAGTLSGIPYNLFFLIAVAGVAAVVLHRSAFGRRVFITGGNPVTAHLVGIRSDLVTLVAYVVSGACAALAGLVLAGFVGVVDNFVGRGFELDSIVAAVVGGIALSGGKGTVAGALTGAAILVAISNLVVMLGLPVQMQII